MYRLTYMVALMTAFFLNGPAFGVTSDQILGRVKAAEIGLTDFRANMTITEADRKTVSGMGEGYGDLLKLEKAVIYYKKPDKLRYDGYARGIKATYIQNGYVKLVLASMIKHRENVKNDPGKRQDTLDLGFLSSHLWVDNYVTVVERPRNGIVKLKFDPKFGDPDKRHDMVWVEIGTLKMIRREKYRGSGELRLRSVYTDHQKLTPKLPIAVECTMYDASNRLLGSVSYKDVEVNVGLKDSLFPTK